MALTDEKHADGEGGHALNGGSAEFLKSFGTFQIITTNSDLLSYCRWNPIFA